MREFVRKVPTASGATAVQVVGKRGGRLEVVAHVGSAHDGDELAWLLAQADRIVHAGEVPLFAGPGGSRVQSGISVAKTYSQVLWSQLTGWWQRLGFDVVDDKVFQQVVLARIVEPVSKADTVRVLDGLGLKPPSVSSIYRSLERCQAKNYRELLAQACWCHISAGGPVGLLLYDVTTLHFEIQEEDELRKSGFSKIRRLEPQILVGLLVDRFGFPLMVHAFEGNRAETTTILPVVSQFAQNRGLGRLTVVADAGMLNEANLAGLEDAGFDFIVGSKTTKFPYYLDNPALEKAPEAPDDGWARWWPLPPVGGRQRNLVIQYRVKRARLDLLNIDRQVAKAVQTVQGGRPVTRSRFLTIRGSTRQVNQDLVDKARRLAGYKGYVTNLNIGDDIQPVQIIDIYHQLFQVERSFRMSKVDLLARPIFHQQTETIQAHLTVVFAALAISRAIQDATGVSIRSWKNGSSHLRWGFSGSKCLKAPAARSIRSR